MPQEEIRDAREGALAPGAGWRRSRARRPRELSGGQQQRVALARALVASRACSCWTSRCPTWTRRCASICAASCAASSARSGTTTVFVTHDQAEAVTLSDRIVVMNRGRIEQIGTPREIFGAPANRWVVEFVGSTTSSTAR